MAVGAKSCGLTVHSLSASSVPGPALFAGENQK